MSIIDNINYLIETKRLIKEALISKGAQITEETPFADYVNSILELNIVVEVPKELISVNLSCLNSVPTGTIIKLGDQTYEWTEGLDAYAGDLMEICIPDSTGRTYSQSYAYINGVQVNIDRYNNGYQIISYTLEESTMVELELIGSSCCVPYDVPITISNGSYKNAEDITLGDEVLAYNESTSSFTAAEVIGVTQRKRDELVTVLTEFGSIEMTPDHPVLTNKGWASFNPESSSLNYDVELIKLTKDMSIMNSKGKFEAITDIIETKLDKAIDVYTFNVTDGLDTFIADGYVVHNAPCPI